MDATTSFSEIYRQHSQAVFRLAWILSGNQSDAEDLTSEAFARALAGEGRIEQATVRSYLYAIVRNLVASRQRRPALEVAADDDTMAQSPESEPGPEQRAELRQRLVHASAGLEAMRAPEREVLLLSGLHGLSNIEIADALGLQPGHVRVRLHRARKQLLDFITLQGTHHDHA